MIPWAPSDQTCKTTPWVFTKGTGKPPGKSVPSFSPFRSNSSSTADLLGGAVAGGRRWRCFTPFEPPSAPCFDPGGTPLSRRFLLSRTKGSGVPPSSLGAIPMSPETSTPPTTVGRRVHLGIVPSRVEFVLHFFPHPSPGGPASARGGVPFSPVAPGRRRRGFSKLPTLCRRLVISTPDTQSPWDAEALVLECRKRASQANRTPSLIVRRGGIPALLPVPHILESRACFPPEPFPRHRWLRASQSSRMAWPVAGDFTRREVQR